MQSSIMAYIIPPNQCIIHPQQKAISISSSSSSVFKGTLLISKSKRSLEAQESRFSPFSSPSRYPQLDPHVFNPPLTITAISTLLASGSDKHAFVFGGGSDLGSSIAGKFQNDGGWTVLSVDFFESKECLESICLPPGAPPRAQLLFSQKMLSTQFPNQKFDIILNATSGFTTSGIADEDVYESVEQMFSSTVESSVTVGKLACSYLKPNGLVVFIGSMAAFSAAPKTIGYTVGNAALHQLVRCVAGGVGDELPKDARVICLVPEVLDTAGNRALNGGKAEANWIPCQVLADKLFAWANGLSKLPDNGALIAVTSNNKHGKEAQYTFRLLETQNFVTSIKL